MKRKNVNKLMIYVLSMVVVAILSFVGIEFGTTETVGNTMPINIAKLENLPNMTIKTGSSITQDFLSETKQNLKVYFFDVGQSNSILVLNEEQSMLIDAGNNDDGMMLVQYLKILGITKIDYLIGTHSYQEQMKGLNEIVRNFDIGTIYMPEMQENAKAFEEVLGAVKERELTITTPKIKDTFLVGQAECKILAVDNNVKNLNHTSIVIQMKFEDMTYLFTGDSEKEVEEKMIKMVGKDNLKAHVLKVGCHGSDTSSRKEFIDIVAPEVSIISVGVDNSYENSNQEMIQKLEEKGSKIYQIDQVGNIFIEQRKRT